MTSPQSVEKHLLTGIKIKGDNVDNIKKATKYKKKKNKKRRNLITRPEQTYIIRVIGDLENRIKFSDHRACKKFYIPTLRDELRIRNNQHFCNINTRDSFKLIADIREIKKLMKYSNITKITTLTRAQS